MDRIDNGRVPEAPGSHASHGAGQAVSALSGFDPSRVTGLGLGKSNDWWTPPHVFEALNCQFDTDVAHPGDATCHVPAQRWVMTEALKRDWREYGFVWMNPPFGGRNGLEPWLAKFFDHGNGIALTPDRTSAPWFHEAWRRADAVMFTRKTPFLLPTGERAGSPAFGTALWAAGEKGVAALTRARQVGFGLMVTMRDSDGSPKGEDANATSFTPARAEGIAPNQSGDS